jgi:NADH-quinone oxidoreductase subunit G
VLEAAIEVGITVPYYCYHPGIGVDGSCRVCIVKIEKMAKLQTSCSIACADGMVVSTRDKEVVDARAGVFEFLLLNHPLDCPVCDKGGECPLQDFSYSFGPAQSRMDFPRRVFDGEGVKADVDFGPTLMLNRNRCILCTRCIRFMQEIDGDAQIGVADRGNGSEIATFEEEGVHSLISGNLMDVCPVGAITTRDYRFKSRPWDNPSVADTVCTLCAKGCATSEWVKSKPEWARGSHLVRVTPRFNPDVNGYWMCDIGRFGYHWVEGDQRLRQPMMKNTAGMLEATGWNEVLHALKTRLAPLTESGPSSVRVLVSAHASIEELFVLKGVADGALGGTSAVAVMWSRSEKPQPAETKFCVPATDAPNVNGARDLGFSVGAGNDGLPDLSGLRAAVEAGLVKALVVVDPAPAELTGDFGWVIEARAQGVLPLLVVQAVEMSPLVAQADIVLAGSAWLEKDALYTNDQGRVQAASQVLSAPGDARTDWRILIDLGVALGVSVPYASDGQIRAAVAAALPGTPYADADQIAFNRPVAAKNWLQASNPSERWKWDFMFQDLPPVKGHSVQTEEGLVEGRVIPLKPVG